MIITRVLRDSCPNGIDCDRILDTDGSDLLIQGRLLSDPAQLASLGLHPAPPGEAYLLLDRTLCAELIPAVSTEP